MKNLTILYEKENWKYQLETNFDSSSIDSSKELADIFAKIIPNILRYNRRST